MSRGARAVGIANIAMNGTVLDTWFPPPELLPIDATSGTHRVSAHELTPKFLKLIGADHDRLVELVPVRTVIADLDAPPIDAHDVFLRLHLLSHRMVEPLTINMDGALDLLQPVVWTNKGPCLADNFETVRTNLRARGLIHVYGIDRLPRMVDYVVPSGVRIGDADRVRLGAHLAEGTTVMHEGFVNFNAGTLGASMVEGRISAGVVVGDGSDIGGGASIMGTLSGGGKEVISVGERCLLGANSGLGISLGDDSVIEAGLYVTSGSKVTVFGAVAEAAGVDDGATVKAAQLSGASGMLLRRNSVTGAIEATEWKAEAVALNEDLHKN